MQKKVKILTILVLLLIINSFRIMASENNEDGKHVGQITVINEKDVIINIDPNTSLKEGELVYVRTGGNLGIFKITTIDNKTAKCLWITGRGYFDDFELNMDLYKYDKSIKEKCLVTTSVLRVREKPDLNSSLIGKIEKGNIILVLSKTDKEVKIDELSSKWYNIEYNGITGWVFGGFITQEYIVLNNNAKLTWVDRDRKTNITNLYIYDSKTKKEISIPICDDSSKFKFSDKMKYVAIDCGTDVLGTLEIYEVTTKKKINSTDYTRHPLHWDGNKLSIESLGKSRCKDNKIFWEEIIYDNGKILKGNKKGSTDCSEI